MLTDFVEAWNQGLNAELYEEENAAIDHDGILWRELEAGGTWAGKDLLDLGCGNGYGLPRYASTTPALPTSSPRPRTTAHPEWLR